MPQNRGGGYNTTGLRRAQTFMIFLEKFKLFTDMKNVRFSEKKEVGLLSLDPHTEYEVIKINDNTL